ncbi:fumarylacetoacetate hydrolase family protein [Ferrimicrobium sp.]|uniref:fumarylacetoacetate hydrolase family protein n=1 Tax=Ferrimicrobium sp. TaxID=2926050 RepID=UPI00260401DE|nr:fumarylacetoacetate hydrolase family protein [Ferrimicrobium sp.]
MAHDINLNPENGFGIDHLPLGIALGSRPNEGHVVTRIDQFVLDLAQLTDLGFDLGVDARVLCGQYLNSLMGLGHESMAILRERVGDLLVADHLDNRVISAIQPVESVRLGLPIAITNYVDFYSSLQHATNLGRLFRPNGDPLTPNWRHLPIGYHGRSSTIVVSGTQVRRPRGLRLIDDEPVFGPSTRLDIEAEVGFVIGKPSQLGTSVTTAEFFDYVAGVVLVNDWSARDIQSFESVPLGPFLGKSFLTSISAWVTPLEALARARTTPVLQNPSPTGYLVDHDPWNLALDLEIELNGSLLSHPPFASTYWTPGQQLAHQTVNGADVRVGDLFASGTVSGPAPDQFGSLIELTDAGTKSLTLGDGTHRSFLEDGDTAIIRASAPSLNGGRLCLGEVSGTVLPPT